MKNKKILIAIIAVVILAAGIVLFFGLRNRNVKYKDLGKITYMKYSIDGEEYEIVKKGKTWHWEDREDLPVDSVSVDIIAKSAKNDLHVEEAQTKDSLKKLGLKNPEYSLTLKDSRGRQITLHVGKAVSEDTYFAQMESDKKVYTVSFEILTVIDSLSAVRSVSEQAEFIGE